MKRSQEILQKVLTTSKLAINHFVFIGKLHIWVGHEFSISPATLFLKEGEMLIHNIEVCKKSNTQSILSFQKKYKINSSSKNINLEVKRLKIIEQITSQTQKHEFKKELVEARDNKLPIGILETVIKYSLKMPFHKIHLSIPKASFPPLCCPNVDLFC